MNKGDEKSQSGVHTIKEDLQEIRKKLNAETERLKALEIRVGAIEQNLLGN